MKSPDELNEASAWHIRYVLFLVGIKVAETFSHLEIPYVEALSRLNFALSFIKEKNQHKGIEQNVPTFVLFVSV